MLLKQAKTVVGAHKPVLRLTTLPRFSLVIQIVLHCAAY
jgi:hypothetical protein